MLQGLSVFLRKEIMMDKKKTVILAYEGEIDKNSTLFNLFYNCTKSNDLLRVRGEISLNEVIYLFFQGNNHPRRYSYRWGWNYAKHEYIDAEYIKNPVNPRVGYIKFVAYNIVDGEV